MSTEDSSDHDGVEIFEQDGDGLTEPSLPEKEERLDVKKEVHKTLEENEGLFLTAQIVAAVTNYSEGHVRDTLHELADEDTEVIRERRSKEIYGVLIGGNFVVLTDDRDNLLDIVKNYKMSEFGKAKSMSKNELRNFIINELASQELTSSTDKLYFGIPS